MNFPLYLQLIFILLIVLVVGANAGPADDYINNGYTQALNQDFSDALNNFDQATQLEPDFWMGWFYKTALLQAMERYDEALDAVNKWCQIASKNPDEYQKQGSLSYKMSILTHLGKYPQAMELENENSQLLSSDSVAQECKAYILNSMGKYDEALDICEQGIQDTGGKEPEFLAIKGDVLANLGRNEDALAAYHNAITNYKIVYNGPDEKEAIQKNNFLMTIPLEGTDQVQSKIDKIEQNKSINQEQNVKLNSNTNIEQTPENSDTILPTVVPTSTGDTELPATTEKQSTTCDHSSNAHSVNLGNNKVLVVSGGSSGCDKVTGINWDFGDGTTITTENNEEATHTYVTPGTYIPTFSIGWESGKNYDSQCHTNISKIEILITSTDTPAVEQSKESDKSVTPGEINQVNSGNESRINSGNGTQINTGNTSSINSGTGTQIINNYFLGGYNGTLPLSSTDNSKI